MGHGFHGYVKLPEGNYHGCNPKFGGRSHWYNSLWPFFARWDMVELIVWFQTRFQPHVLFLRGFWCDGLQSRGARFGAPIHRIWDKLAIPAAFGTLTWGLWSLSLYKGLLIPEHWKGRLAGEQHQDGIHRHTQAYNQWEFQDPKMEVLYHIRPYFLGIFPLIQDRDGKTCPECNPKAPVLRDCPSQNVSVEHSGDLTGGYPSKTLCFQMLKVEIPWSTWNHQPEMYNSFLVFFLQKL